MSHTTDEPQGHIRPRVAATAIRPQFILTVYTQSSKLSPPIAITYALCLVTLRATVFAGLLQLRCRSDNNSPMFLTSVVMVNLLTILQPTSLLTFID